MMNLLSQKKNVDQGEKKNFFSELCEARKKRQVATLSKMLKKVPQDELNYALNRHTLPKKMSGNSALSYLVETSSSKNAYQVTRATCAEYNTPIFPPYHVLLDSKKLCYPNKSEMEIQHDLGEVKLQIILDLTTRRYFQAFHNFDLEKKTFDTSLVLTFSHKWGFDGAGSQKIYRQKFPESGSVSPVIDEIQTDSGDDEDVSSSTSTTASSSTASSFSETSLFSTSFVSLKLAICSNQEVVWQNPKPNSHWFNRPLKIYQGKRNYLSNGKTHFEQQMQKVSPTIINLPNNRQMEIHHEKFPTMLDGEQQTTFLEAVPTLFAIFATLNLLK
eukprot:Pompholyxophrys_sp_v1_NODE_76_length_2352_cov_1.956900.p1 type:complete len:330 gc:universal NODE_76_length_2352_cov_1.956900:1721-732(-)